MDGIAKTSLLTAAMRAAETKRSDSEGRLFSDPYAELLAGNEGLSLMQKGIAASGDQPAIAIRTAFFDQKINEALKKGFRQIVMLAAGMDTRAYRLSFPEDMQIFELDRKEVFEYKQKKLYGVEPRCARHVIAVDLRKEWSDQLLEAGFNRSAPTVWLVEGLLMYLEEKQVADLLEKISLMASANDILLFDILSRTLLDAPMMKSQLEFLQSIGAPWRFGVNEPEKYMKNFGWDAVTTQAGEFAPSRWPFPVAPRNVPDAPRGFFAEALRL